MNYQKDIIKFTQELISIPSVNGVNNETAIINAIANQAKKLDLPFKIIEKDKNHPNIFVGENFSKNTGLLLIAHVDTAGIGDITKWSKDPFSGKLDNGKLYGRGAIDNKAGIALSLYTLKVLKDEGKLHLAKFIGVADEERGADSIYGARYLLDQGLNAKAAIYTYPGHDAITIGHRGQVKLWIEVNGESAHTGSKGWQDKEKGASAIDALGQFLNEIRSLKIKGSHKDFPGYKFVQTVLQIEGGSTTSLVPDKAKTLLDARLLPNQQNEEYISRVNDTAKSFETEKIKFSIKVQTNLPGVSIRKNEKIVKILQRLSQEIFKISPDVRGCGPANEGYMFIKTGIPTICGFGVSGDGAHSKDEYLMTDSIDKILNVYVKTAQLL